VGFIAAPTGWRRRISVCSREIEIPHVSERAVGL